MYLLFLHLLICYIRSIAKTSWRFYGFSSLEPVCLRDEAANLCHSFTWQFATLFFRTLAACHGFFEANRVLVFLYITALTPLINNYIIFPFFPDSICSCTNDLHVSQRTLDSILRATRFRRDEPAHLCHFFIERNRRIVFCAASLRLFTVFWHLRHDFIQTRQPYLGEIPWRPIMPNNKCL